MQGFAADPVYVKGEVFACVGLPQNLKDLQDARGSVGRLVLKLEGYLAHKKTLPHRTLQLAYAWGPTL